MQFTSLTRQYNVHKNPNHTIVRFVFMMCTIHLHTLLTECCTHIYFYIADDTLDICDGGGS